jgi:uncharacterized membrane protein
LIDDEVKMVALALIGVMVITTAYPLLVSHRPIEAFSELAILGENGRVGDYPKSVRVDSSFNLLLYVGNYEGRTEYYQVLAKVGDQGSNIADTTPLIAAPIASWDMVLMNNQNKTLPVTLSISNAGTNRRLVFELHVLDPGSGAFVYHQRWIQIWLNVTTT